MSENRKYYYMKLKENFFTTEKMVILESAQDGLFYSNLLCSTLPGKAVCKLVWDMDKRKNTHFLELAIKGTCA